MLTSNSGADRVSPFLHVKKIYYFTFIGLGTVFERVPVASQVMISVVKRLRNLLEPCICRDVFGYKIKRV